MKGRNVLCEVDVPDIATVNTVFQWFDGIATVRTRDKEKGLIELWISPDMYDEAMKVISYIIESGIVRKFEIIGEVGDDWCKT